MKRVTIADVAQRAGVSKSTVSHALSGKRPISDGTRRRILSAASALGYQPNPVAQRLAGGATRTIGCAMPLFRPQIGDVEFAFVNSVATVLNNADYAFLLLTHMERSGDAVQRMIVSGLVDGLILMQVETHDARVEWLRQGDIPFLLLGRCEDNDGLAFIDSEIEAGLREAVGRLAAAGHRHIAYLHMDTPRLGFVQRAIGGFKRGCEQHALMGDLQSCGLTQQAGAAAMEALLARRPETTAVIVWNDAAALGAIQLARAEGRSLPADLALVTTPTTLPDLMALDPIILDILPEQIATRAASLMLAMVSEELDHLPQELIRPTLTSAKRGTIV